MNETSDIKPYHRLANAIIMQAAVDYQAALKILDKNPKDYVAKRDLSEIERFFRSNLYRSMTNVDGEYLMKKLREVPPISTPGHTLSRL